MIHLTKTTMLGLIISALFTSASYAHTPLSYNEVVQAERARMEANNPTQPGNYVKPTDETWLLRTPGTWGYLINKEKLRMKASLPVAKDQPGTTRAKQTNHMPTTLNEGVRYNHEKSLQQ